MQGLKELVLDFLLQQKDFKFILNFHPYFFTIYCCSWSSYQELNAQDYLLLVLKLHFLLFKHDQLPLNVLFNLNEITVYFMCCLSQDLTGAKHVAIVFNKFQSVLAHTLRFSCNQNYCESSHFMFSIKASQMHHVCKINFYFSTNTNLNYQKLHLFINTICQSQANSCKFHSVITIAVRYHRNSVADDFGSFKIVTTELQN